MKLSKDDKYYEIKLSMLNAEKNKSLKAADNFDKKNKIQKRKRTLYYYYFKRQEEAYRNSKFSKFN